MSVVNPRFDSSRALNTANVELRPLKYRWKMRRPLHRHSLVHDDCVPPLLGGDGHCVVDCSAVAAAAVDVHSVAVVGLVCH